MVRYSTIDVRSPRYRLTDTMRLETTGNRAMWAGRAGVAPAVGGTYVARNGSHAAMANRPRRSTGANFQARVGDAPAPTQAPTAMRRRKVGKSQALMA